MVIDYLKIYTFLSKEEIEALEKSNNEHPELREAHKALAREIITFLHGKEEYDRAVEASGILFGNATSEALKKLDEKTFLQVFDGVTTFDVARERLPLNIIDLLAVESQVFPSKGECRKMIQAGGVSINKDKVTDVNAEIGEAQLLDGKYVLAQKGKKNYFIIRVY